MEEIKDLTRLKDLDICLCSKIYDLEDISRFSNLESLCISYTPISDLTPLTELSRLNTLTIEYSGVRDYTPLAGCPKLRQIYLNHAMAQALNRQLPEQDYELILVD